VKALHRSENFWEENRYFWVFILKLDAFQIPAKETNSISTHPLNYKVKGTHLIPYISANDFILLPLFERALRW